MKAISICYSGTEDVCASEIRELCSAESEQYETVVFFDIKEKILLDYCYLAQAPNKILAYLHHLKFKKLDDIIKAAKKIKLNHWTNLQTTFRIECTRIGNHDFNSTDVSKLFGEALYEQTNLKVDLKNPDLTIYMHIFDNNCYIGIDITSLDHSKRDYKVFSPAETIKAPIAYTLLRLAKYRTKDTLLNPLTNSGVIAIEAALYSLKKSVHYYEKDNFRFQELLPFKNIYYDAYYEKLDKKIKIDKLNIFAYDNTLAHVKYTQKNSKIAGVTKQINISKVDIEWFDTKFKEKEIDKIVTLLPSPSKRKSEKQIQKIYKELFYQTQYILNDKGLIVTITKNNELLIKEAEKNKFKNTHERTIMQGQSAYKVNVFKKA